MSVKSLKSQVAKMMTATNPGECRCRDADDSNGIDHNDDPADVTDIRVKCDRCGGFYLLRIVEVLVDEADEPRAQPNAATAQPGTP